MAVDLPAFAVTVRFWGVSRPEANSAVQVASAFSSLTKVTTSGTPLEVSTLMARPFISGSTSTG